MPGRYTAKRHRCFQKRQPNTNANVIKRRRVPVVTTILAINAVFENRYRMEMAGKGTNLQ